MNSNGKIGPSGKIGVAEVGIECTNATTTFTIQHSSGDGEIVWVVHHPDRSNALNPGCSPAETAVQCKSKYPPSLLDMQIFIEVAMMVGGGNVEFGKPKVNAPRPSKDQMLDIIRDAYSPN